MKNLASLLILALLLAATNTLPAQDQEKQSHEKLNQIQQSAINLEAATKTLRVEMFYDSSTSYPKNVSPVKSSTIDYLEDGAGRIKITKNEVRIDRITQQDLTVLVHAVFDGSTMKQLETSEGRFTLGRISQNKRDTPWSANPRNFLSHYFNEPISKLIAEGRVVQTDADSIIVIESPERHPADGSTRKYRFHLRPDHAIVRREVLIQPAGIDRWFVYGRIRSDAFIKTTNGILVPTRCVEEMFDISPIVAGTEKEPVLLDRTEYSLANWNFSPEINALLFQLEFPQQHP